MQFEYQKIVTAQETIDIEDVGNCALQTFTAYGETKVLIIKTTDGISEIIEFGPANVDIKELPDHVVYIYDRFEFNQRKVIRRIDKFIQDESVIQVLQIEYDQAKQVIKSPVDIVIKQETDYDKLV